MKNSAKQRARQLAFLSLMVAAAWTAARSGSDPATSPAPVTVSAMSPVDAGRYLVTIGGCNDCHTAGWMETGGNVPEAEWLAGTPVGWRGPWGTTYPSNLRLLVSEMDEEAWVTMLRTRRDRPPMPWMNINRLSEADARAIYAFVKSLGNTGGRMPTWVAPDIEPATPYFVMEPQHMERLAAPSTAASQ